MLFAINNLTKTYEGRKVLDIPELFLEKGRVCGLLGPNGSGKTTLLEILSFLLTPSTGEILYESRKVVFSEAVLRRLRMEVVMVEQQPILFTSSVRKNVEFGLKIRKTPRVHRRRNVDELLDLVGMRDFAEVSAHKLSGGETQRVAIARALACSPKVILFDEPTANVDIENQIAIENILRDINIEQRISVVFATHDRIQAARLSDHIVFLFNGRPASSIYENIFSGPIGIDDNGQKYCLIRNRLRLPVRTDRTGLVKISADPNMIEVCRVQDSPARHHSIVGLVMQLTHEGSHVRAIIDVGVPFSVLLSQERYRQDPILTGERVALVCPPQSIEVI